MRTRRNTELLLLIAALPLLLLLFAMYLLNTSATLSLQMFIPMAGLFLAFVISHLVVRKVAPGADPALLPIVFLLSGIGIIFVMRLAPDLAIKQTAWLYVGIAAMIVVLVVVKSIEKLGRYKYTVMLAGIVLLLLPAVVGTEIYGSKIWLSIGPFSFQPGEIAKVLVVIFLAAYLAENRELLSISTRSVGPFKFPDLKTLFPLLVMLVISLIIMVFERDLGSALLFFGIFLIMLYTATGRWLYVIVGALLFGLAGTAAYHLFGHVRARIEVWLHPFDYAQDQGYQLVQAIYSMADGGLFGTGIGRGLPTKIPVVESDFIFSAIAEEMGLLGASAILLLFILFMVRGFLTASRAKSDVAAFTAVGLTVAIAFQAFVIVGGTTRLIPLTGLTLPFMSQGGSSLLASFIIVGLLLRVGDEGTGLGTEMTGTVSTGGGVLGRYALGRRIVNLTVIFAVLFAVLIANLTYIQVIRADYYRNLPSNNHTLEKALRNQRGTIITSDGVVLAESVLTDDGLTYARVYPQGSLAAHVVGYSSLRYGQAGIEASANDYLVGQSGFATVQEAIESMAGIAQRGNDVLLTIDAQTQMAAEEALRGYTGAVVVLDPANGAILAEASSPTYDLNDIESALASEEGALYNRATQGLYAPGSTFKVVTLAAALEQGIATAESIYDAPASIDIGGAPITNYAGEEFGQITLQQATEVSSNTVFAQVADQLGSTTLVNYAEGFGFNDSDVALDFTLETSLMPIASEMTQWETAWAGCGQPVGEHASPAGPQATVMQMALVMSAVANDGVAMRPYLIDRVTSGDGTIVAQTESAVYARALSSQAATATMRVLTDAVQSGSAYQAQVDGATVAGKTGTAQTGRDVDDAWFIGTAEANGQRVVIAIVIEQGGTGGSVAAPLAATIMETALRSLGAL